jgi:multidrug efflux system membrane fusion protein
MRQWFVGMISRYGEKRPPRLAVLTLIVAIAGAALATGVFSKYTGDAGASTKSTAPAGLPVAVARLEAQTVNPFAEFSGRINAVDYAEIRPQVAGRITEIRFHDGEHVNEGEVLLVIDPRPYQAAVDKAQADLQTAINNAKFAKAERERGNQLVKANWLSQETFDQRVNADEVAKAAVQSAQSALESAQINLDYAYVKAPISGRVSRAEITVGNLVGSPTAAPPVLTSIVSDNGVYADFEVDEQTYLNNVRNYGQSHAEQQKIPVDVVVRATRITPTAVTFTVSTTESITAPAAFAPGHDSRTPTAVSFQACSCRCAWAMAPSTMRC